MDNKLPRLMIAVWRWNESEVYGLKGADQVDWSVEGAAQRDTFVQIDKDVKLGVIYLIDLIRIKLETHQIMLFLHNNQDYGYNSDAAKKIVEDLGGSVISRFVIRLFTGGTESVYYTPANKLGILGTKGTIPIEIITNLDDKIIKKDNFDTVWNNYFVNMKDRVYQFKENFFRWAKAYDYDTQEHVSYLKYLSQEVSLWASMYNFIGEDHRNSKEIGIRYLDFSACLSFINLPGNERVAEAYKEAQKEMRNLIKSAIIANNDQAQLQTQKIYHQLTNLWKAIP